MSELKKKIIRILIICGILFSGYYIHCIRQTRDTIMYIKNDNLATIKDNFRGIPMCNGRFEGGLSNPVALYTNASLWRIKRDLKRFFSFREKDKLTKIQTIRNKDIFTIREDAVVWLGHAGLFIRLEGINILVDPCMTKPPFTKRIIDTPCDYKDFKNIDYLLISHDHPDHLDFSTLTAIDLNGSVALVPLGVGALIKSKIRSIQIQEAGWYQKYNTPGSDIEIYLIPAKHWSMRNLLDVNKTLWGGFIIKGKNTVLFISGDTAYSPHFKEIKNTFDKIDICLMTVGAYKPKEIMSWQHLSPEEAVRAFNDLGGRIFIPVHYGTFDLSEEPYDEPVEILESLFNSRKGDDRKLQVLNVGEEFYL